MKTRNWWRRRYRTDAPTLWKDMPTSTHAQAWADGYNAAVRAYEAELRERLADES